MCVSAVALLFEHTALLCCDEKAKDHKVCHDYNTAHLRTAHTFRPFFLIVVFENLQGLLVIVVKILSFVTAMDDVVLHP